MSCQWVNLVLKKKCTYRAPAKNGDSAKPIKNRTANIPEKFWTAAVESDSPPQTMMAAGR